MGPTDQKPTNTPLSRHLWNFDTNHINNIIFDFGKPAMHPVTFMCLWMVVFWLLQPISVPATGFIPIFFLPATGILSSTQENIAIFILSGMVLLLLNLSGMDKRIVLKLLCCGDVNKFTGISSIFSVDSYTSRYRATEPNYDEMRYIVLSCVQTSAAIAMRAIFESINGSGSPYPDVFSFTQYFIFAFPVTKKNMSISSKTEMMNSMLKYKTDDIFDLSLYTCNVWSFFTIHLSEYPLSAVTEITRSDRCSSVCFTIACGTEVL
ncbi:unnamed protein product [Leptidea sinapis]|uniref:Uncharacterized protein n=1 Tax=Leptidea sinapis TaxID=189913 RepID=A0A5E4QL76_9NEOP|nr:unnamed protein product [Leptidea sinapis]